MTHDVFISYEKHDLPVAEAICQRLEANGVSVWYAPRDILPGANWVVSVLKAIERCRVVVFIYSKSTDASEFIPDEINQAKTCRRPIIPFCLSPFSQTSSLKFLLSTSHWLDAYQQPLDPHYQKLVATVRSHLAAPVAEDRDDQRARRKIIATAPDKKVAATVRDDPPPPRKAEGRGLVRPVAFALVAAIVAGCAYLVLGPVSSGGDVAAPQASIAADEARQRAGECARRLAEQRGSETSYTSLNTSNGVQGRAEVLCLDVLSVGESQKKIIQLAGVGRELVHAEDKLADWINSYGGTMDCRPAGFKYRCHVGGAGAGDVSDYILRNNWAARDTE